MTDLADRIEHLIRTATQAGREIEQGRGLTSNIPVEAARQALYDRLHQHGLDGTGWMPEAPGLRDEITVLTDERDRALARVDELEAIIVDLHERLGEERERADRAEAAVREWEIEAQGRSRPLASWMGRL